MNDRMGTESRNRLLTVQIMVVDLYTTRLKYNCFNRWWDMNEISRIEWRTFVAAQSQAERRKMVFVDLVFSCDIKR